MRLLQNAMFKNGMDAAAKTAKPFLLMELCYAQLQAQSAQRFGKTPC
ncbi:MAG: hypothetical protein LBC72_03775 [Spirochaetaceae bacterium]|jgi:hypothetical protein|nr:hypothetical protein [Spirochaetaceae bacterium]